MRTLGYGLLCVNELLYHCTLHAGDHVIANMVISALPLLLLANLGQGGLCYIAQQLRLSAAGTAVFVRQCTESCTMCRCIFALRMPCQSNEGQTHAKTHCNNRQDCTGSSGHIYVVCQVPVFVNSPQVQQNMQNHTAMLVMGHATSHRRQL